MRPFIFHQALADSWLEDLRVYSLLGNVLPGRVNIDSHNKFVAPRAKLIDAVITGMEHLGQAFSFQGNLPYSYYRHEWPEAVPIAGYSKDGNLAASDLLKTYISNWHLGVEHSTVDRLAHSALWMISRGGFGECLDYILDLQSRGFNPDSKSTSAVLIWLFRFLSKSSSEQDCLTNLLKGPPPRDPAGWMDVDLIASVIEANEEKASISKSYLIETLLHGIIVRCLAEIEKVRRAPSWGHWLVGQSKLHGLLWTVILVFRNIAPSPPIRIKAILSQFEEIAADSFAIAAEVRELVPFNCTFVLFRAMTKIFDFQGTDWREVLRRERLWLPSTLDPDAVLVGQELPEQWRRLSWRFVHPIRLMFSPDLDLFSARTYLPSFDMLQKDIEFENAFVKAGLKDPERDRLLLDVLRSADLASVHDPEAQAAIKNLIERSSIAEFMEWVQHYQKDLNDSVDVLGRLLENMEKYPWNWFLYQELGIFLDDKGRHFQALRYFMTGIRLNPENSMLWGSISICLRRCGYLEDSLLAKVISTMLEDNPDYLQYKDRDD